MTAKASRLGMRHTPDLVELENAYPPAMRQGEKVLRSKLRTLESYRLQLSFILHDEGRCVGYLVAYPQRSLLDVEKPDRIVYIDDIQVVQGHEAGLYRLLKLLSQELARFKMSHWPIEGVCRRRSFRVFQDHQSLIRRLGWELAGHYAYWDDQAGEEMCWMRWWPLAVGVERPPERDRIDLSGEQDYDDDPLPELVSLEPAPRPAGADEPLPELVHLGPLHEEKMPALTYLLLGDPDSELVPAPENPPVRHRLEMPGVRSFFGNPRIRPS
ncbi:MAG: hypothetical protein AB7S38_14055 [Vulcanimicrobiota bacterium]